MKTALFNARILTSYTDNGEHPVFANCVVVDDESGKIIHVGSPDDDLFRNLKDEGGNFQDMEGRIILPGLIDSHMHLLMMGESLEKLDLNLSTDLDHVRKEISSFAKAHPDRPRVLCRNWRNSGTKNLGLATQLDDLDSRPIYVEADDLHSVWCNTAALLEMDMDTRDDPPNGKIHRGADGKPSGLLSEGALIDIVWPFLASASSLEERLGLIQKAFDAYVSSLSCEPCQTLVYG
jgi:predicted amidohydrolase YtcJ